MKSKKKYNIKRRVDPEQLSYYIKNEYLEDDKEYLKELEDEFRLNGFIRGRKI